jgi:hypothetical protein
VRDHHLWPTGWSCGAAGACACPAEGAARARRSETYKNERTLDEDETTNRRLLLRQHPPLPVLDVYCVTHFDDDERTDDDNHACVGR